MASLTGYWSVEGFKIRLQNKSNQKNVLLYLGDTRSDAQGIWTGVAEVLDLSARFDDYWFSAGNPHVERCHASDD